MLWPDPTNLAFPDKNCEVRYTQNFQTSRLLKKLVNSFNQGIGQMQYILDG